MRSKIYPDLQKICRLCLKENGGTVCIFPKAESLDKFSALSIPMRIIACASLEVQDSDDYPKKICNDCRLQLEKSYYFRKMSQAADIKLRKHLRLLSMGKVSKVFTKKLHDDELEFKVSLEFIEEQENKRKQEENRKFEENVNDIKLKYERELETATETIKAKCQDELASLIREEIKEDLRKEFQNELGERLRQEIMDQCLNEAKELVRKDVREECRQSELKSLLGDIQTYLTNRKQTLVESPIKISNIRSIETGKKQSQEISIAPKLEHVEMERQNQSEGKKATSNQSFMEEELNIKDENFLIDDTDEEFCVQNKMSDESYQPSNNANEIECDDDEMEYNAEIMDNNREPKGTTATSYRNEENLDPTSCENRNMNEGYLKEFEEAKCTKPKKQLSSKTVISPDKTPKTIVSSTVSRTKTTVEATVLTRTYVNPMQRSTDTPKIYRCNDCPVVFSTKHSLERHLRTHKKVKRMGVTFQCPECRIVVSCGSALRRHMYTHCEKKPFPCNLCEKSFVQKEILKRHMQSHAGAKPHQCPHCSRAFAQRINLTQHINRNHLEEPRIRQHSCHLCPKRFNHASGLSRHLTSHSGVIFQCSECNRNFGDRSSIKRHIAYMHSDANIMCFNNPKISRVLTA